jgi:hypothetical protein
MMQVAQEVEIEPKRWKRWANDIVEETVSEAILVVAMFLCLVCIILDMMAND